MRRPLDLHIRASKPHRVCDLDGNSIFASKALYFCSNLWRRHYGRYKFALD